MSEVLDEIRGLRIENAQAHEAITVKIQKVDKDLATHLGEHAGCDKAESKSVGKVKKIGIWIGAMIGAGGLAISCMKLLGG